MAGLINKETDRSVDEFIASIDNNSKREDSKILLSTIREITGFEPKMWGNYKVLDAFIGFGNYKYKRKNGKEEFEWFHVGLAPRKAKITLYLTFDISLHEDLLKDLGKCKWGKGCLYINKLADVNLDVLKQLIERSKDARWH